MDLPRQRRRWSAQGIRMSRHRLLVAFCGALASIGNCPYEKSSGELGGRTPTFRKSSEVSSGDRTRFCYSS